MRSIDIDPDIAQPIPPKVPVNQWQSTNILLMEGPEEKPDQQDRLRGTQTAQEAVEKLTGKQGRQVEACTARQHKEEDVLQQTDRG